MAFSLRKMFSNITYFKKSGDSTTSPSDQNFKKRRNTYVVDDPTILNFDSTEPDSTSRQCTSLNLPESVKNFAAKKGSLSDTDLLTCVKAPIREKRKRCKKLKLDIKKASQSMNHLTYEDSFNVENTPKHILLECKSSDVFSGRFKNFDFNKSFDLIDAMSDDLSSSPFEEQIDIDSLSENSDSEQSIPTPVKMCRKVSESEGVLCDENQLVPSASLESFADVELYKSEEERLKLIQDYQNKLQTMECFLRKLLKEFQFHVEVSKIFYSKTTVTSCTSFPDSDISKLPKNIMHVGDRININGPSPTGSWNVITGNEDVQTKSKLRKQLLSIKSCIEEFVQFYFHNYSENANSNVPIKKCQRYVPKRLRLNHKKKIKYFDFPDLRDAMINLFSLDGEELQEVGISSSDSDESDISKCMCKCHPHSSPSPEPDSGITLKTEDMSTSITSSIGNFSLDSLTLTAYSESLDHIVSYNSFEDTSLYNTLLQKAAIDRVTFYVQVHSIELKCTPSHHNFESKNIINFHCLPCKDTQQEENGLLRHILSQSHCEKIHFLYKTAYIKKCVLAGKEIQPSTVLNPMKMYRDDNKIVCFGDALYACSLCFENLIIGESVLMAHCSDQEHIDRRERLSDILG